MIRRLAAWWRMRQEIRRVTRAFWREMSAGREQEYR